jgi:hypothetical protein
MTGLAGTESTSIGDVFASCTVIFCLSIEALGANCLKFDKNASLPATVSLRLVIPKEMMFVALPIA